VRRFSSRPTLTLRGHKLKDLRRWSGTPTYPPLTDLLVATYVMAAVFDVISTIGRHQTFASAFFRSGTYVTIGGAVVSVLASLTGLWDWLRSTANGTQARRSATTYAWTMITVSLLAAVEIALRLNVYDSHTHPTVLILVLSILVATLVSLSAAFGGTLVYDYGFDIETD
jgi:uncharacterized membrane protein